METSRIKCPHCGEETASDKQRCEVCGELIGQVENNAPQDEQLKPKRSADNRQSLLIVISVLLVIVIGLLCFSFFRTSDDKWEYKVVKIQGNESEYLADFASKSFSDQTGNLNNLGKEGWELVSVYTETETKHCNFGKEEYVTGIQPNVRTNVVTYVLKRKIIK